MRSTTTNKRCISLDVGRGRGGPRIARWPLLSLVDTVVVGSSNDTEATVWCCRAFARYNTISEWSIDSIFGWSGGSDIHRMVSRCWPSRFRVDWQTPTRTNQSLSGHISFAPDGLRPPWLCMLATMLAPPPRLARLTLLRDHGGDLEMVRAAGWSQIRRVCTFHTRLNDGAMRLAATIDWRGTDDDLPSSTESGGLLLPPPDRTPTNVPLTTQSYL